MLHKFILTTNYINCKEAIGKLQSLPKDMDQMGLFYGNAGRGKSLILEKLAIDEGAILVRTIGGWTSKSMLIDICEALEIDDTGFTAVLQHRVIDYLIQTNKTLIIDEIDTLFEPAKKHLLLMIRDIHDLAKTPIILTGMESCEKKFQRDIHYYDRFARIVQMGKTTREDIRNLCMNSDVQIEDDLIEYFFNKHGSFRPVKVLITALEEYCENNDIDVVNLKTFRASGVEKLNER